MTDNGLGLLWTRFQRWRAMRMLARIPRLEAKALALYAKATRLLGPPPAPLLDRIDRDGR